MTLLRCVRQRHAGGLALAAVLLLLLPLAAAAVEGADKAPDWPNLLSEAGRRAAWALPESSAFNLEPTLADIPPGTKLN